MNTEENNVSLLEKDQLEKTNEVQNWTDEINWRINDILRIEELNKAAELNSFLLVLLEDPNIPEELKSFLMKFVEQHNKLKDKVWKLEELAYNDALTKLPNRRKAMDIAYIRLKDLKEWSISNLSFSILDIDFFKKVNDIFWHDAWDKVLVHFSKFMNEYLQKNSWDNIFRLGWEEFFVLSLLPKEELKKILDNALNEFSEITHEHKWRQFSVTFSWWINEIQVNDKLLSCNQNEDFERYFSEQLHETDLKLYDSKHSWRAQISI
jgi:diguanylate cyclase (GGDEF)-like protein